MRSSSTAQNQLAAGSFINTEPRLPGNRKLGFLYQLNAGVQRELLPGFGVTVDYVGSRGHDQTGLIDINEPRLLPNGTIGRPGPSVFDPDGTRVPASARAANFQRVLEYQTSSVFNSDYDALEVSLDKRFANRWSGRASYTLSRSRDVAATSAGNFGIVNKRVNDDFNPGSTTVWRPSTTGTRSRPAATGTPGGTSVSARRSATIPATR